MWDVSHHDISLQCLYDGGEVYVLRDNLKCYLPGREWGVGRVLFSVGLLCEFKKVWIFKGGGVTGPPS